MMKISIVTVAFNEEKNMARTIESVLNQTSIDIEYIICDGKSTDETVEIANTYKEKFAAKGIKYIVNSEKDSGIYDGMNKGIDIATGEYIFFLNAGDWFYSDDTIEKVINVAKENGCPDFIYGDIMRFERGVISPVYASDEFLRERMSVLHPGLFSTTEIMKRNPFELKYSIAADYDFVLNQKLQGKDFFKIDAIISFFAADGVSSKNFIAAEKETEMIRKSYGLPVSSKITKKYIYKMQLDIIIKSWLPQKLWELWSVKVKGKRLYSSVIKAFDVR